MEIRSGPATVLGSGTVTGFGGQPIAFHVQVGEEPFTLEMTFERDGAVEDVAVHSEVLPAGMRFRLVNFDGPDGRGSAVPVLLGEVGDALLFMHFRVFRYGRTEDRTVHYTFYHVGKEEVAWAPEAGASEAE